MQFSYLDKVKLDHTAICSFYDLRSATNCHKAFQEGKFGSVGARFVSPCEVEEVSNSCATFVQQKNLTNNHLVGFALSPQAIALGPQVKSFAYVSWRVIGLGEGQADYNLSILRKRCQFSQLD